MTRQEALAEAQRRWGPPAKVYRKPDDKLPPVRVSGQRFNVGYSGRNGWPVYVGSGDSWEAAFADADARSSR